MASRRCPLAVLILCALAVATAAPSSAPKVVTTAAYFSSETDHIDTAGWMRTLYGVQFDADERKCASEDKILYRPSKQCFELYHRGPCQRYEWLVFDKERATSGNLTAVCKRRMCAPSWGYNAAKNVCFEQSKCQAPTSFHYTLFGDGVCRCNGTKGRLATAQPDDVSACYDLYHYRPCRKGSMMAPRYRLVEGMDAMCISDPCAGYTPPSDNGSAVASKPDVTTPAPAVTSTPKEGRPPSVPHDQRRHDHGREPPPTGAAASNGRRNAPPGRPHVQGGFQTESSGNFFPRGRDASGSFDERGSQIDVEAVTDSRPDLSIKTFTRGVIASDSSPSPPNYALHDHWDGDHEYLRGRDHGHDLNHEVRGLPGFKISLKPIHLILTPEGRVRRDIFFPDRLPRNARGEPNPHVESREGRDPAGSKVVTLQISDARNATSTTTQNVGGVRSPGGATNDAEDYTLEVQYSNGDRSCMTSKQLNVICDLMMWPLFSEMSELKVPICVNTLFRFALGRVGKSDECAENDAGKCAQKVVVKSPDPLDWELE